MRLTSEGKTGPRWWLFWAGGGLLVGSAEIAGNGIFLRFPVLFPTWLLGVPFAAILGNGVAYLILFLGGGLLTGVLVELIRHALKRSFSLHLCVAGAILAAFVIYLAYGINASELEKHDPTLRNLAAYRPVPALVWAFAGGLLAVLTAIVGYRCGILKSPDRAVPWLAAMALGLVAFNLTDRVLADGFPRIVLALLTGAAVVAGRLLLGALRPRAGAFLASWLAGALAVLIAEAAYFGWPGKDYNRHLLLMVWDAQPARLLGVYGYSPDTTPYLSANRDHMILFKRAYSPANYTFASHVSIFTGRYLREHHLYDGTFSDKKIYRSYDTLAEDLAKKGYRPLFMTENPWIMPITKGFREAYNFPLPPIQSRNYFLHFYRGPFLALQIIDQICFHFEGYFKKTVLRMEDRHFANWLLQARRRGPYFIFINWMYFHSRYVEGVTHSVPVEQASTEVSENSIRFTDSRLKKWVEILSKAGQAENTLILLTADHGEFMGEFGLFGHAKTLLEPVLHVPLLLFGPGIRPEMIEQPVPLVALKSALDVLLPHSRADVWNIRAFIDGMLNNRGMVVEGSYDFKGPDNSVRWFLACWDGKYKYMQDCHEYVPGNPIGLDKKTFRFFYDLDQDPGEKTNLIEEKKAESERLRTLISQWEERLHPVPLPRPIKEEEKDYPPGLIDQLRALGYMR